MQQFRKVNRERNFWIYKHNLFHRDRPEDLHLLRRRTCPGVDGRKNRFVPVGTKPETATVVSKESVSASNSDDSLDSSSEDEARTNKRCAVTSSGRESKRTRRQVNDEGGEDSEDEMAGTQEEISPEKAARTEMLEQSLVVSQVAMKLEEYARKAKKAYSLARVSRTRGGVVTPPTGSSFGHLSADTGGLLTYDDEAFEDDVLGQDEKSLPPMRRRVSSESIDDDASLSIEEDLSFGTIVSETNTPVKLMKKYPVEFMSPPVEDLDIVKGLVSTILANDDSATNDQASVAAVIGFCMSTAPGSGDELFNKVYHLLSSSDKLAGEFHEYRAALHPLQRSGDFLQTFATAASARREHRVVSVHQIERNASRADAVREFKTFAVNYFHKVLLQSPSNVSFTKNEETALRYTADVWLRSVCASS